MIGVVVKKKVHQLKYVKLVYFYIVQREKWYAD
jgi:hypothetical protein